MKKELLILMLVFYSIIACSQTKNSNITTSSIDSNITSETTDSSVVSGSYIEIIEESTDSISWYLLDSDGTNLIVNDSLGIYDEILASRKDYNKQRIGALISCLTYSGSFCLNRMIKESTFIPDIAVVFYSSKGTIVLYYSFYCDLCRFWKDGQYEDHDGELIRSQIIDLLKEVFEKDKFVRKLSKQRR